jgi:osmotically-inducible protein OsmY
VFVVKTDLELQQDVHAALEFEPGVNATRVGVTVDSGVVALRGDVITYQEKLTAERTARDVHGVRALANDLQVKPTCTLTRGDPEIAKAVANVLDLDSAIPPRSVQTTVQSGWVTLTGEVPWQFQRMAAEGALRHLFGIKGIVNLIRVMPHVKISDVKARIEAAFRRSAEIDAKNVRVEAHDGVVTLSGRVHSLGEREAAEQAAWAAPGVTKVEDRLLVAI